MTTLEFARKYIRFNKSSPITGNFREEYYPFVKKPFEAADDIRCKRLVIFKASSCLGTVVGQIINAKRIVCDVGDALMVCQTDAAASDWSKTRGKEWLKSIPDVMRLLSSDKYSITNDLWLFRHKFLAISGPGINSAQSTQVRYVQTDESHLEAYPPGRLVEFEKRLGGRFDRQATHITTAPDKGKEIDGFYHEGDQNECHWRCRKCAKLFWPLTGKDSRDYYNGELVLNLEGDIPFAVCPHCQMGYQDNHRDRYDLVRDSDYVAMNPVAPKETQSFRWSVWFAHWIGWRDLALEYKQAMAAAIKTFDLKPFEDWEKKRLCKSYIPTLPDFGDGKGKSDYKLGDIWSVSESLRVLTGDPQAGIADDGAHIHALVTEWDREGQSRRQLYRRVPNFPQFAMIQQEQGIKPHHVLVDGGHELRTCLRECGKRGYNVFRGSPEEGFLHLPTRQNGGIHIPNMPYSQAVAESGIIGAKEGGATRKLRGVMQSGACPPGWAWVITGANQTLYGYLYALITGSAGRYFGIASDMDECYVSNMPAFIPVIEPNKKTGVSGKMIWRLVRQSHYWDLEVLSLVVALRCGYFPLAKQIESEKENE